MFSNAFWQSSLRLPTLLTVVNVMMLELWSSSPMASLFAFCFLSVFVVLLHGVASGDTMSFRASNVGLSPPIVSY